MDAGIDFGLHVIASYLGDEFGTKPDSRTTARGAYAFVIDDADQILEVERAFVAAGVSASQLHQLEVAANLRKITPSLEYVVLAVGGLEVRPMSER